MARKLKTYQTSLGFFEQAIAAPSMKAALEAWAPTAISSVAVRDTGHGLRAESLPCLFEPFYTTKPDGMGMVLSISRSIIESHGGRLWATGCEPRGALFQFTIPTD